MADRRLGDISIVALRNYVHPTQCPYSRWRKLVDVALTLVDPPAHLAQRTEYVADEREPIGISMGAGGSLVTAAASRVVYARAIKRRKWCAIPRNPVAQERHIDGVAVRLVGIGVEALIALKQYVMRPGHVTGVEPRFDPEV